MFTGTTERPASTPDWPLRIALALVGVLVVGVLIAASMVRNQAQGGPWGGQLELAPLPAPAAGGADCARLLATLPGQLDGGQTGALKRRRLATPAPAGAAGWGEPPVVLRCGLTRPAELTATSQLLAVSGVQFLETSSPGARTWVAVDRPVYVAVALPPTSGSGPLQQIATVVARTLPQQDVDVPR